jgi:hypothetical protein
MLRICMAGPGLRRGAACEHFAALTVLALAGAWQMRAWFLDAEMPLEDFAGYVAAIEQLRDALLRHGRVPRWCEECLGGTTWFWSSFKETLAFPLAALLDSVLATKLCFFAARLAAGAGLYALVVRGFGSKPAGLLAGYAYAFGAISSHETSHLDVPVSMAFLPLFFLAALETLQRQSLRAAVALGALTAAVLANSYVQVWLCPLVVAVLLWLRPWRAAEAGTGGWRAAPLARAAAVALAVFLLLAASQLAWLFADSGSHAFFAAEELAFGQQLFVERSPFLFANRDNWLGPWLSAHGPPGLDLAQIDGGRRYLGGVALAVCAAGWIAVRRDPSGRRWYQTALLLFAASYGLALGPHTLLGQLARAFAWSDEREARVRALLLGAAALAAVAALGLFALRHRRPGARIARAAELALGLALLFAFPCVSLWSALRSALPLFAMQRSPGHFFDVAPLWLYLLFGLCAAALLRRVRPRAAAGAAWLALGALTLADFWPSARAFEDGTPLAPLRELRRTLAELPDDGGTARIGFAQINSGLQTWLATGSGLGLAWSWVDWQAGRHWPALMRAGVWDLRPASAPASVRERPADTALLSAARIRYFLLDALDPRTQGLELPPPWRQRAHDGRFGVWEQPDVAPAASAHRAWAGAGSASDAQIAPAAAQAWRNGAVLVAGDAPPGSAQAAEPGRRSPVLPVSFRRFAPERILLETDAGPGPALVFVSEGYHPWWRARVDGAPAEVLRAQLAFLAVPVGPGAHRIELRLERPIFVAAADGISRLALLALAFYALRIAVGWPRARRARGA